MRQRPTSFFSLHGGFLLRLMLGLCAVFLAGWQAPSALAAPLPPQVTTLTPSGANPGRFGQSVAVSGSTLVIGAPTDSSNVLNGGRVSIYTRTGEQWSLQAELTGPQNLAHEYFGTTVAIDGDTLVVSSLDPTQYANGYLAKLSIFTRSQGAWKPQQHLTTGLYPESDRLTRAFALKGDTLAVSSYTSQSIFIYQRNGTVWVKRATLPFLSRIDSSGYSPALSLTSTTLAATMQNERVTMVYERTSQGWKAPQLLNVPGDAANLQFDDSIALNGDRLVVGGRDTTTFTGVIYVYSRTAGIWAYQSVIRSPGSENGSFGDALALSGDRLLVGAPDYPFGNNDGTSDGTSGAAFLYTYTNNAWQSTAFLGVARLDMSQFGQSVALDADRLYVGAPATYGQSGSDDGAVQIARRDALTRAAGDTATTAEEQQVTIPVLKNDTIGTSAVDPSQVDIVMMARPANGIITLDAGAGTITYTPKQDFSGVDTFTYAAGWGNSATVRVTVKPVADAPVITSAPVTSTRDGAPYTYSFTSTDPDSGDTLRVSAPTLPAWLTLTDLGSGTAVLSGTAPLEAVGAHPVTLLVTDQTGRSASQSFTLTVTQSLPDVPRNLRASVDSRSSIKLEWDILSANAGGIVIERRTGDGSWEILEKRPAWVTTTFDTRLTCQVAYAYRAAAYNQYGQTAYADPVSVTIDDCTISAPQNLMAYLVTTDTLRLDWDVATGNETAFIVEESTDGGRTWSTPGQAPGSQTYFIRRDFPCGADRSYRVFARNAGHTSEPSNTIASNTCPPAAPTNLRIEDVTARRFTLRWDDISVNEAYFFIERLADDGQRWEYIGWNDAGMTSFSMETSGCGSSVTLRVVAISGAQNGISAPFVAQTLPCDIIYVRADATGANDGTSWANAYTDLQQALAAATPRGQTTTEIWVARGTYRPTSDTNREATFALLDWNGIYGGFAGTETTRAQRDWRANPTILSGDIGVQGDTSDNSYHVTISHFSPSSAVLDGFTITGGQAYEFGSTRYVAGKGGGMQMVGSNATLRNIIFMGNRAESGGGLSVTSVLPGRPGVEKGAPTLINIAFIGNSAGKGGGLYAAEQGTLTSNGAVFSGNTANQGGGIFYSLPGGTIANATFSRNETGWMGGAVLLDTGARLIINNSIFSGNRLTYRGALDQIRTYGLIGQLVVNDSLLQSALPQDSVITGIRNLVADPLLVDDDGADNTTGTVDDDLRLLPDSPAIDRGNNEVWPRSASTDMGGLPRFVDSLSAPDTGIGTAPIIDMGAYEHQIVAAPTSGPTALQAERITRTSIEVRWRNPDSPVQGVVIERRMADDPVWMERGRVGNTMAYVDQDIACGMTYLYRVRAFNSGGMSPFSAEVSIAAEPCDRRVLYVDGRATGANDGSSWRNAYARLTDALGTAVQPGDEIWIAQGTYTPSATGDRTASFVIPSGAVIYGGFAGTEQQRGERDHERFQTILSGDLARNDPDRTPDYQMIAGAMRDNSFHVVVSDGTSARTLLDGVTIRGGAAYVRANTGEGGGLKATGSQMLLRRVTFMQNAAAHGGGLAALSGSTITLDQVIFRQNTAYEGDGGGMYSDGSDPVLSSVVFVQNATRSGEGAGLFTRDSNARLNHVEFMGNSAVWGAGGMHTVGGAPSLADVVFDGNTGDTGGMVADTSTPSLRRVYFRNNTAQDTSGGGGMYTKQSNALLIDVLFTGNLSRVGGGGMTTFRSSPTLVNVRFAGNRVTETTFQGGGGGMLNISSNPALVNVLFAGNRVTSRTNNKGGAMDSIYGSHPTMINVTLTGNQSEQGAALSLSGDSSTNITNAIIWNNTSADAAPISTTGPVSITHSIVAGGWAGAGNLDTDPRFVSAAGDDGQIGTPDDAPWLLPDSPAINMGDSAALPADAADLDGDGDTSEALPFDLRNVSRVLSGTVDMGAYEMGAPAPLRLAINYATGAPGSAFLITARDLQPGIVFNVQIGTSVVGRATANAAGEIRLVILTDARAIPGVYSVTLTPEGPQTLNTASTIYELLAGAPLRTRAIGLDAYEVTAPLSTGVVYRLFVPIVAGRTN